MSTSDPADRDLDLTLPETGQDTDDAIDKAGEVGDQAERAARESGYADRGESEEASSDG